MENQGYGASFAEEVKGESSNLDASKKQNKGPQLSRRSFLQRGALAAGAAAASAVLPSEVRAGLARAEATPEQEGSESKVTIKGVGTASAGAISSSVSQFFITERIPTPPVIMEITDVQVASLKQDKLSEQAGRRTDQYIDRAVHTAANQLPRSGKLGALLSIGRGVMEKGERKVQEKAHAVTGRPQGVITFAYSYGIGRVRELSGPYAVKVASEYDRSTDTYFIKSIREGNNTIINFNPPRVLPQGGRSDVGSFAAEVMALTAVKEALEERIDAFGFAQGLDDYVKSARK